MRLRLSAFSERVRASLFLLPMAAVFVAVAGALLTLSIDSRFESGRELPFGFASTVDSARSLLSTIAGATISFAGIAFSVSLLVIQQASSQYSPRVVHTLFRDPFNKRVMALVVGTFSYCVMVLRSVRTPLEEGGDAVIPNLSVAVAVLLGVAAVLAVIAFIDHNAHTMDVSEILDRVADEAVEQIRDEWSLPEATTRSNRAGIAAVGAPVAHVRFRESGWVQQLDIDALTRCRPEIPDIVVHTAAGRYAVEGAVFCSLTAFPDDPDAVADTIRHTVVIGATRTMQQDVSYGLRQLVDVALRALSPGINDPTTAQDALFHLLAVLGELLRREPPPTTLERPGGHLVLAEQPDHAELVRLAYDEIRRAAVTQPTVCIYLLESLKLLTEASAGRTPVPAADVIAEQALLVLEGCAATDNLPADVESVRHAYRARFAREAGLSDWPAPASP